MSRIGIIFLIAGVPLLFINWIAATLSFVIGLSLLLYGITKWGADVGQKAIESLDNWKNEGAVKTYGDSDIYSNKNKSRRGSVR